MYSIDERTSERVSRADMKGRNQTLSRMHPDRAAEAADGRTGQGTYAYSHLDSCFTIPVKGLTNRASTAIIYAIFYSCTRRGPAHLENKTFKTNFPSDIWHNMHPRSAPGKPNLKSAEAENRLELYCWGVQHVLHTLEEEMKSDLF